MYILAMEASTTAAKAMLFDTKTNISQVKTKSYTQVYEDVSIHDPEQVFLDVVKAGKELCSGIDVDIIVLGDTWHSLLLCDKHQKPVTPTYLWSHVGAAELCKVIRKNKSYVHEYYNKTGCMVNAIYPYFKLKLLQNQGYNLKDHFIMGQGSYNTFRLTGEKVTTACMASGSGLMNIHSKRFDESLLRKLDITQNELPKIVDSNATYPLNAEGAGLLDQKVGIPVIAANADGGLNQVGVGAMNEGIMSFSVGTSGAMRISTDKPLLPEDHSTWCYLSPKGWMSGAATSGCCNCIDWFINSVLDSETSYKELESNISASNDYPVFLPFLFGERCPGWNDERKGGFFSVKPEHTNYDLYVAILEGVLFNLYQCYQSIVKVNGEPTKIKISGGILNSEKWVQMCADIFNKEMYIETQQHSSLMGSVVMAKEVLGVIGSVGKCEVDPPRVIKPNPDSVEHYKRKFEKYLEVYNKEM